MRTPGPRALPGIRAALAIVLAGLAWVAPAAARAGSAGCTLRIVGFAWDPNSVHAGDRAAAVVRAQNCTQRTLVLTRTVVGEQIPPCPTIDPISTPVTIGPDARYVAKVLRLIAPPCTGVEVVDVAFTDTDGTVLARASATLHVQTPEAVGPPR
jgi:hypothetical protein